MSNVPPINPAVKDCAGAKPDAVVEDLLLNIESGTIGIALAADALEKIEDELAQAADDDGRALYATLFLIREKLRSEVKAIEQACERARAVVCPSKATEAQP